MRLFGLGRHKAAGDDKLAAFETMLARDWDRFWRYALRLCNGVEADAEDLLADSVVEAFQSFDRYSGRGVR